MKHLIWGLLGISIGVFLLLAALVLANVSVETNLICGGLFVAYGSYRLKQYFTEKQQQATNSSCSYRKKYRCRAVRVVAGNLRNVHSILL